LVFYKNFVQVNAWDEMNRTRTKKAVSHLRVSTRRQGESGFGLAAQRFLIARHFKANNIILVKEFVEIGSGRPRHRPKAEKTIEYCRKHELPLYVAHQSRLARNVGFVYDLIDSGLEVISVANPTADKRTKIFQALMDEMAADDISNNTKNALVSARKKGVKFGGNSKKRQRTMRRKRKAYLKWIRPIIRKIQKRGFTTTRGIMRELIRQKVKSPRGIKGGWHISTVYKVLCDLSQKHTKP
jgi:DNA invertase Pin-like site-specific DNA recombinase